MGGFGGGGWGSVPWGGSALEFENPPADFDIFCFYNSPMSMGQIFTDPDYSTIDMGANGLRIDGNSDLVVDSGLLSTPTISAFEITTVVPSDRTLEFMFTIDDLPSDFSDLQARHIFIGTTTTASSCAGLFFSAAGIGYVGSVHYTTPLILDSTFQLIPGSNAYVQVGVSTVVRIAINDTTGSVYLYVTPMATLSLTGHILRAILPVIDASTLAFPPTNRVMVSGCGTVLAPTVFRLDELCLSSQVLVANLAPIADAGIDRSLELCSILRLDGSASFDPEGANLLYRWRLTEAPATSIYSIAGHDGRSYPVDLSGFTDKFYSPELGALLDPVVVGDVLVIGTDVRSITAVGVEVGGPQSGQYFLQFASSNVPDNLASVQFKVLRQRGIYLPDEVVATFLPDVAGFYRFDLIVSDGLLPSAPSVVVINVLEAILPRGVVPDVSFIFGLMSDFWGLVEDTDRIETLWSGISQVVSGELLSLWQHDYAKSLRDVQRQFTRKWLHYDLLLPEPIPELTKVRFIPLSVESNLFTTFSSFASYPATTSTLTIRAVIRTEPFTIKVGVGTVTSNLDTLCARISGALKQVDQRFTVDAVGVSLTGSGCVRITAPFAFEIVGSTFPQIGGTDLFVLDSAAQQPHGTSGADPTEDQVLGAGVGLGTNLYRIERAVPLLGIGENDVLCLDGVAYRIATASTNISDTTDLILKDPLPSSPSRTWKITSYVTSELLDFWNGLVAPGDVVSMELAESNVAAPSTALYYDLYKTTVTGMCEAAPSMLPIDLSSLPIDAAALDHAVRLAKVLRRTYVPISPLVLDVPTLSAKIVVATQVDEEAVLRRNIDYFIEPVRSGTGIRFVSGLGGGPDVWEALDPPDRCWAEFTYLDNRPVIEQNFGIPVEFTLDKLADLDVELDYLSAVRGLWYAYFNGPTLYNLRVGTQILLGLPFAEEAGTIVEIRTDFSPTLGRILIQDTKNTVLVRSYTYPRILGLETNPTTKVDYVVGDTVVQFAPLVEGAVVTDYIKDPQWFQGLLNQGYLREVDKYFRFLVSVDSAAFNLSAFLAVRDFILKMKPVYTYPLVVVISGADRDDEITVDDTVTAKVKLNLFDSVCAGMFGSSTIFDHYRGDGTIYNQFDADANPLNAAPTFDTSDTPVLWAFDKEWLCPEDVMVAEVSSRFAAAGPITVGQCFLVGEPYTSIYKFVTTGPFVLNTTINIPVDPPHAGGGIVNTAGVLSKFKVRTKGGPDAVTYDVHGTGSLTVVSGATLVEGEVFTISLSALDVRVHYEFDSDGVVTAGRVPIPYTTADSVATVRDSVINAINSKKRLVDPSVYNVYKPNVIASIGGPAVVLLTADILGTVSVWNNPTVGSSINCVGVDVTGSVCGSRYAVFIYVNGVSISSALPLTPGTGFIVTDPNGSVEMVAVGMPHAVSPGDVVSVFVAGVGSATPRPWDFLEVTIYHDDISPWYIGQVLPAGTYRTVRLLT